MGPILNFVTAPILARILGPEGRGEFAAIMQPITVGTGIAVFGVPTTITYFIGRGYSRHNLIKIALCSLMTTTTFVYGFLILYAFILSESQKMHIWTLISIWSFIYISVFLELRRSFLLGIGSLKSLDSE
ncbi:MAG: hypothetical protein EBU66_17530, partial [Bacteroidetes bacterium]|nr:hypothetical protein [Bacteroidota bacterium]